MSTPLLAATRSGVRLSPYVLSSIGCVDKMRVVSDRNKASSHSSAGTEPDTDRVQVDQPERENVGCGLLVAQLKGRGQLCHRIGLQLGPRLAERGGAQDRCGLAVPALHRKLKRRLVPRARPRIGAGSQQHLDDPGMPALQPHAKPD
jgi:hypothetical protein